MSVSRPFALAVGAFTAANIPIVVNDVRLRQRNGEGIVALELVGDAAGADRLLDEWGPEGIVAARNSLRWDFVYQSTYAVLGALAVGRVNRHTDARDLPARAAVALVPAAAVFDAIEGVHLLRVLAHGPTDARMRAARAAALTKFGLLAAAAAHVVAREVAHRVRR